MTVLTVLAVSTVVAHLKTFWCAPNMAAPRVRSQDLGIPALEPPKAEKWKNRNSGFGPLKTGKGSKSEKKKKTGRKPEKCGKHGNNGKCGFAEKPE